MHLSKRTAIVWAVLAFLALAAAISAGAGQAMSQTGYLPLVAKHALPSTPVSTQTGTPPPTPTPTSTPQDAPPFIHIRAPSEALVGDTVILDASGTWDVDGDAMQFSWTQYHNPDRYDGLEYVTGNDVRIESLDGAISVIYPDSITGVSSVKVTSQWPGNYR
jgi:hypothetical protein